MSIKIQTYVYDSHLEPAKRWVLNAMADHADDDGRNIYPSVAKLARKTGYSERQVQRILQQLAKDGIIYAYGKSKYGTKVYYIHLPHLAAYIPMSEEPEEPPAKAPAEWDQEIIIVDEPQDIGVTYCHPPVLEGGDIENLGGDNSNNEGVTFRPFRGVNMSPESSLTKNLNHPFNTSLAVLRLWQLWHNDCSLPV